MISQCPSDHNEEGTECPSPDNSSNGTGNGIQFLCELGYKDAVLGSANSGYSGTALAVG